MNIQGISPYQVYGGSYKVKEPDRNNMFIPLNTGDYFIAGQRSTPELNLKKPTFTEKSPEIEKLNFTPPEKPGILTRIASGILPKLITPVMCGMILMGSIAPGFAGTIEQVTDSRPAVVQVVEQQKPDIKVAVQDKTAVQKEVTQQDDAIKMFSEMGKKEQQVIQERLQGTTKVLFFSINNRQAFVEGKAMGKEVFPLITEKMDSLVKDNKISLQQSVSLKKWLGVVAQKSPQQRAQLVDQIMNQK